MSLSPAAAQEDDGLFSVAPSSQTVADRPPAQLTAVVARNTTAVPLDVRVFPVILGQSVDGAFTFSETTRDLNAASKILTPRIKTLTMAPGTSRNVELDWNLLPRKTRAAFLGVIFEARAKPADGQQVKTVQRLLTVNFLRLPGPYRSSGRLTRLRASQGPGKTLLFYPRILNTGEFIAKPRNGKFRIRNAEGEIVFQTTWSGDVVLPTFQREFPITMKKVLPAGEYGAVATADFGRSLGLKIIERFTLVGPNELPTGRVVIEEFRGSGVLGGDSQVKGVIKSVGTAPAKTAVRLDLYKLLDNGQQPPEPMKTQRLEFEDPIAPGQSAPLEQVYPDLPAGKYRVIGTYRAEEGSVEEVVTDFSPVKERSAFQKFKDWLRDYKGLLIGLGLLLALLLLIVFFRRRQRRLERELEEARQQPAAVAAPSVTGATPPPPTSPGPVPPQVVPVRSPDGDDDTVNINTAGVAELQTLPGVGPKAAERIVAHRDEYGAFRSPDDLAAVEGFDGARIEALRSRVGF